MRKVSAGTASTSAGRPLSGAARRRSPKMRDQRIRIAKEQADALALKNGAMRGELLDAKAVEREWSETLRGVRAGMLAVPSRAGARLPHLTPHDIAEIDAEVRAVLTELGNG